MKKISRTLLVIDDLFSSEENFWLTQSASIRNKFEQNYKLVVYPYPSTKTNFEDEFQNIKNYLREYSSYINILILDIIFPGNPTGGLQILEFIEKEKLDIAKVIIVSNSDDQALQLILDGKQFVHREKKLDLEKLLKVLDEKFLKESLYHPRKGILITHGTDTLSYLIEFLRYGVRNLQDTNIIATGSQISMNTQGAASDAIDNVRSSVLLLQHLYAPEIGVVFNRGESFFRSNIQKISKWHPHAFYGDPTAHLDWDHFKPLVNDLRVHYDPKPIEELILFRTGGTIESTKKEGRGYVPGGDFVASFITGNLAKCYRSFRSVEFSSLDSSNLTVVDWCSLLSNLAEICDLDVDTSFEKRIGLLVPTPFMKTKDYISYMERFEGVVIAGYGAGNGNTLEGNQFSLIEAVKEVSKNKPIVLASQVPKEIADFAYEVGLKLVKEGCIPSGNLSYQASMVRLSYILGHPNWLSGDRIGAVTKIFLQGLTFRDDESKQKCEEIFSVRNYPQKLKIESSDSLTSRFFEIK